MAQQELAASPLAIGGLGPIEWVIILAVILLLFGARKLPDLARSLGSSINSFKEGLRSGEDAQKLDSSKTGDGAKRTIEHEPRH